MDCEERVERRLLRGQGTIGAIFWLKNHAGWRDKSPDEVQESDDWLTKLLAGKGALVAGSRAIASPVSDEDAPDLTQSSDTSSDEELDSEGNRAILRIPFRPVDAANG